MNNTQKYIVLRTLNYRINDPVLSLELRRMEKGLDHRVKYSLSLEQLRETKKEAEYLLALFTTLENLNFTFIKKVDNLTIEDVNKLNNFLEQLNIPTYETTSFLKQKINRRDA